jgi:hypothetical protein
MNRKPDQHPRGFRLLINDATVDGYGVALQETNGSSGEMQLVARANPGRTRHVMPALLDAVRKSGHAKTVLSPARKQPVALDEESGVRLCLLLLAADRVSKPRRIEGMADGIAAMTGEETYYWYAKVTGRDGLRHRRALRLFLAEE